MSNIAQSVSNVTNSSSTATSIKRTQRFHDLPEQLQTVIMGSALNSLGQNAPVEEVIAAAQKVTSSFY